MLESGELILGRGRTIQLPELGDFVVGVYRPARGGFGFLQIPNRADLFVPAKFGLDALDGDTVRARVLRPGRRGGQPSAEIVRIVERAPLRWVGRLEHDGARWSVQPRAHAPLPRVVIDESSLGRAREGDLLIVEPLAREFHRSSVRGLVRENLGPADGVAACVAGVLHKYGLSREFSAEALREAESAAERFEAAPPEDRLDLRQERIVTIDPVDARDFDDAISIERLDGGGFELGVHVADVAYFVPVGGALDLEAARRGTSVYFPKHVVPMLPETLSAGVCSLQPGVDRLARSVFIAYDAAGLRRGARFANSVIRSTARLTYEEASAAIDDDRSPMPAAILELLRDADTLARRIQARRLSAGMISLALPEVDLRVDDAGRVVDAAPADDSYSHTIIEMFMIEANEAVSERLHRAEIAHARRIHPQPEPASVEKVLPVLRSMNIQVGDELSRGEIRRVLEQVRGKPAERVVSYLLLRCMPQAYYGPDHVAHFALASEHYTHFTSPIRRYPDLLVHRLLDRLIRSPRGTVKESRDEVGEAVAALETQCAAASQAERTAQEAEREARQYLLMGLMRTKLGQSFDAVVSGMNSRGVYVQIAHFLADAFIPASSLGGLEWLFDREMTRLIAPTAGRVVSLGMPTRVTIDAIDESRIEIVASPENVRQFGVKQKVDMRAIERDRSSRRREDRPARGRRSRR